MPLPDTTNPISYQCKILQELTIFFCFIFSVDKMTHMVGSYPPKAEIQSYLTPFEEAPAGEKFSFVFQMLWFENDVFLYFLSLFQYHIKRIILNLVARKYIYSVYRDVY